jgi:hypothetical protein
MMLVIFYGLAAVLAYILASNLAGDSTWRSGYNSCTV